MYNFIAKHIFAPSLDLIRGTNTMEKLQELEQSQWWSRDKILELQNRRLQHLISYAYDNVPYYRQIFDERSLRPGDIETGKYLHKLPVLTKKLIKTNYDNLVARNFPVKKRVQLSTSGSTGEPLIFYNTKEDHVSTSFAAEQRVLSGLGIEIGDKIAHLSVKYQADPIIKNLSAMTRRYFRRMLTMYLRHALQGDMPRYASKIQRFNPVLLRGCPSAIYPLAKFIQREPEYKIRPKAIVTGGEQLFDYQRTLFREVFNCEVFDRYGSEEQHTIAFQCSNHSGYHIVAENTIVEVVDDKGECVADGEKGRILITNLNNFAMPFIRYDIGDVGIATNKSCSCGRGLPMLDSLEGRSDDVIVTKSKGRIPGPFLYYPAYITFPLWGIEHFQFVQEDYDNIQVKIVLDRENAKDISEICVYVIEAYKKVLGDDMNIGVEVVDEIPLTHAGKRRAIISKVKGSEKEP